MMVRYSNGIKVEPNLVLEGRMLSDLKGRAFPLFGGGDGIEYRTFNQAVRSIRRMF